MYSMSRWAAIPAVLFLVTPTACSTNSGGYSRFRPTEVMITRLVDPAFRGCVDEASEINRLDLEAIQGCYTAELGRLEGLLAETLNRRAIAPPRDQEQWNVTFRDRCDKENGYHGGWGWSFELQSCYLDELRRRILWVKTEGTR